MISASLRPTPARPLFNRPRMTLCIAALAALLTAVPGSHARAGDGPLTVKNAWIRPTPPGVTISALYAQIANSGSGADRLTGATSPAAKTLEVHESKSEGGMMQMRKLAQGLAVPAHGAVTLAPGSYHIMMIDVTQPLVPGAMVAVTLHFQHAGAIKIMARVGDAAQAGGAMRGHMQGSMQGTKAGSGAGATGAPAGGGMAMPHGAPAQADKAK